MERIALRSNGPAEIGDDHKEASLNSDFDGRETLIIGGV